MILRHHNDGSYSITDMTRADVDNLAFGASCAASFTVWNAGTNPSSWVELRATMFGRLGDALRRIDAWGGGAGRRIDLLSDSAGTVDDAYTTRPRVIGHHTGNHHRDAGDNFDTSGGAS